MSTQIAAHWIISLLATFLLIRSLVGMLADKGRSFRIKISITGVQIDWNSTKAEDAQDGTDSCDETEQDQR
ncbi:hypothetical protein [Actinokineospora inagensis]|uniref:hypothetical protein n=1 Tax=Actinokineospora inagensis TaxID=103730 RepID=UPI00042A3337|nr:hypothetical protein [Actinokineospora inagensis]